MAETHTSAVPAQELRDVALSAHAVLLIESARLYGLVSGGPQIDVARCEEIITAAARARHSFTQEEIQARALDLVAGLNAEANFSPGDAV